MVDAVRVEAATRALLEALGEDPDREGLQRTPRRVAEAWKEMVRGNDDDPREHLKTVFEVENDQLVLVRDMEFHSLCEHHLLPFIGKVHVAYLPANGKVTGLSKLARCVDGYARRLQVQERLTEQIAEAIDTELTPKGLAVIMQAEHMCMTIRGVQKPGSTTVTSTFRGDLAVAWARSEVLNLINLEVGNVTVPR